MKICEQYSYSVKVVQSKHRGAGGPSSVMATDEGGQSENGGRLAAVFPDGRCPTAGGALMARGVAGAAQEKTGSESINCPESDNKRPLCQTIPRK